MVTPHIWNFLHVPEATDTWSQHERGLAFPLPSRRRLYLPAAPWPGGGRSVMSVLV